MKLTSKHMLMLLQDIMLNALEAAWLATGLIKVSEFNCSLTQQLHFNINEITLPDIHSGTYSNPTAIIQAIRRGNPDAVVAINRGGKILLKNNNPGPADDINACEDYTFGHMVPHKSGANPVDGCYNYGLVLSAEASNNGYVYPSALPSTELSYPQSSNPYLDANFEISYPEPRSENQKNWHMCSCLRRRLGMQDSACYGTTPKLENG